MSDLLSTTRRLALSSPRAELLHTLELTDFQRAGRIGELWLSPKTRSLAELLIDAEEDRMVCALLIGC